MVLTRVSDITLLWERGPHYLLPHPPTHSPKITVSTSSVENLAEMISKYKLRSHTVAGAVCRLNRKPRILWLGQFQVLSTGTSLTHTTWSKGAPSISWDRESAADHKNSRPDLKRLSVHLLVLWSWEPRHKPQHLSRVTWQDFHLAL